MDLPPSPPPPEWSQKKLEGRATELMAAAGLDHDKAFQDACVERLAARSQPLTAELPQALALAGGRPAAPSGAIDQQSCRPDRATLRLHCGMSWQIYGWKDEPSLAGYRALLAQHGAEAIETFESHESRRSRLTLGVTMVLLVAAIATTIDFGLRHFLHFDLIETALGHPCGLLLASTPAAMFLLLIAVVLCQPLPHRAAGFRLHGKTYLVFQGTCSLAQLLLTDAALLPWGRPLRHLGFIKAWRALEEEILKWLKSLPAEQRRLTLTGHSLGGALALLAAYDLSGRAAIDAVVTFGAPRPGLFPFRRQYLRRAADPDRPETGLGKITWRFTHGFDPVSRIPPPILYCHLGPEFHIFDSGRIEPGRPPYLIERLDNIYSRFEPWWNPTAAYLSPGVVTGVNRPMRVETGDPAPPADRVQTVLQAIEHLSGALHWLYFLVALIPIAVWAVLLLVAAVRLIVHGKGEHECGNYKQALDRRDD